MKHYASAICCLVCLAGCGGGGAGGADAGIDPRLGRLDVYEDQKLRILGNPAMGVAAMPVTVQSNVPTSGSMMFMGSATVRVENGANPIVLFGDAELTVGFDNRDGAGTLDNFFGNNANGAVVDYAGSIGLLAVNDDAEMTLDYSGTLTAPGETLGFAGQMDGTFLGNPLGAFAAADLEANVDQGGTDRNATVVVIGEVTQPP